MTKTDYPLLQTSLFHRHLKTFCPSWHITVFDTSTYFTAIRNTSRWELLRSSEDGICFLRPSKQSFRTARLKVTNYIF